MVGRLRNNLATLAEGASLIREVHDLATEQRALIEGYDLRRRSYRPKDELTTIRRALGDAVETWTARLQTTNTELQSFLSVQANLISATANLWLQIIVILFGIMGILVSGVGAYYAIVDHQPKSVQRAFQASPKAPVSMRPQPR